QQLTGEGGDHRRVLDPEVVEVCDPCLQVIGAAGDKVDRVVAGGGCGGIGGPSQLDRDVDSGQLQDHGVAGAGAVVVIEPGQVLGVEHPPIPVQAGVQVGDGQFDVMEAVEARGSHCCSASGEFGHVQ